MLTSSESKCLPSLDPLNPRILFSNQFGEEPNIMKSFESEIITTLEDIKTFFRLLAENGCQGFECSKESLEKIQNWGRKEGGPSETLEAIRTDLGDCRRCRLSEKRKTDFFINYII